MVRPKPNLRTHTVSTKVTEEEFAALEAQAVSRGLNLGEWVRDELLKRMKPEVIPGNETLFAEVMALRTIVINLAAAQVLGQAMSQEKIQELIDHADRERFRRTEERIGEAARRRGHRGEEPIGDGER